MKTGLRGPAFFLTALVVAACTQIENPRTLSPAEPGVDEVRSRTLQRLQFDDVPVPRGFSYVTRGNRSFSYQGGGVRVGQFVYWGRDSADLVGQFYLDTMPLAAYGWKWSETRKIEDGVVHRFAKREQICEITIQVEPKGTYVTVFVTGPA